MTVESTRANAVRGAPPATSESRWRFQRRTSATCFRWSMRGTGTRISRRSA